jgi:hypothetical protein
MHLPGFTAARALDEPSGHYRSQGRRSQARSGDVVPQTKRVVGVEFRGFMQVCLAIEDDEQQQSYWICGPVPYE